MGLFDTIGDWGGDIVKWASNPKNKGAIDLGGKIVSGIGGAMNATQQQKNASANLDLNQQQVDLQKQKDARAAADYAARQGFRDQALAMLQGQAPTRPNLASTFSPAAGNPFRSVSIDQLSKTLGGGR